VRHITGLKSRLKEKILASRYLQTAPSSSTCSQSLYWPSYPESWRNP